MNLRAILLESTICSTKAKRDAELEAVTYNIDLITVTKGSVLLVYLGYLSYGLITTR